MPSGTVTRWPLLAVTPLSWGVMSHVPTCRSSRSGGVVSHLVTTGSRDSTILASNWPESGS